MKSKNIFLIDGLGAIISTFCLVVLVYFEDKFGMPKNYLYLFITIGSICSIYSISCYFLSSTNWRKYLTLIAISNLLYCGLTAFAIYINAYKLTSIGYIYFCVELVIIITLAVYELKKAKAK